MHVEGLGLVMVGLGLIGLASRPAFLVYLFISSTLLGASAAFTLPALGGANIQPASLMLGFVTASLLMRRKALVQAGQSLLPGREGFWLMLTAVYAVVSVIFFPRVFAGMVEVFPISRAGGPGAAIDLAPLDPTSGNLTQIVYFLGDVVCFLVFYVRASTISGIKLVARAFVICAAANLVFAALDLITYWTHTMAVLDVIRNANYQMWDDADLIGFKRIVGSFPEASAFAYATVGLAAFCCRLWLSGVHRHATGPLTWLSFAALIFATSSTGYAGVVGFITALYLVTLGRLARHGVTRRAITFLSVLPSLAILVVIWLHVDSHAQMVVQDILDKTVFNKLNSESGVERSAWTAQAFIAFVKTDGLGAGVGSLRASSFPIAVLGQVGVIGALTYAAFFVGVLFGRRGRWSDPTAATYQAAARWACFAQLVSASVAGSYLDLGLPFFVFAALACSRPQQRATLGSRAAATGVPARRFDPPPVGAEPG